MRTRLISFFLLAAAGLLSHSTANADILRCSDAKGSTLYTDSACPAGMRAVSAAPLPQSCSTEDCERLRERDIEEARERLRAEKEQLAAYTAERHKRELEDRWLDEARYEAQLRSAAAVQASYDEAVYPVYPLVGIPARCGRHCLTNPHRRVGRRAVHAAGNEPRRTLRGTTAGKRAGYRAEG